MDPIKGLNVSEDSTLAIMSECFSNKYSVWHFQPNDVSYLNGRVFAEAENILELNESKTPFYKSGQREKINLKDKLKLCKKYQKGDLVLQKLYLNLQD